MIIRILNQASEGESWPFFFHSECWISWSGSRTSHSSCRKEGRKGACLPCYLVSSLWHTVTFFSTKVVNEVIKAEGEECTAPVTQTEVALQRWEGSSAHQCPLHLRGMKWGRPSKSRWCTWDQEEPFTWNGEIAWSTLSRDQWECPCRPAMGLTYRVLLPGLYREVWWGEVQRQLVPAVPTPAQREWGCWGWGCRV